MTSAAHHDEHGDARLYQHELLSRADLDALLARYRSAADRWGSTSRRALRVRDRIILANMRLIAHVAQRYSAPHGMTAEDLRAFGVFGLITAIEKFDLAKGVAFSTYATWWIRHAIGRSIADLAGLVRVPVHASSELNKLDREGDTDERRQLLHDAQAARCMRSLDAPITTDGGARPWIDVLEGDAVAPLEMMIAERTDAALHAAIEALPARHRFVIDERMKDKTLAEVGRELEGGRSRERVRQIEQEAHALLRARLICS